MLACKHVTISFSLLEAEGRQVRIQHPCNDATRLGTMLTSRCLVTSFVAVGLRQKSDFRLLRRLVLQQLAGLVLELGLDRLDRDEPRRRALVLLQLWDLDHDHAMVVHRLDVLFVNHVRGQACVGGAAGIISSERACGCGGVLRAAGRRELTDGALDRVRVHPAVALAARFARDAEDAAVERQLDVLGLDPGRGDVDLYQDRGAGQVRLSTCAQG